METPPPDLLSLREAAMPVDWHENKKALEMQVPDWLLKLVYKCLEKAPEDRFENGIALHDYISLHHLYTAEVAGIVQNEDHKWKAVVADKDYELQDLKAIVSRQDKELQMLRQKNFSPQAVPVVKNGAVSRSAFNVVLLLLLVVGALAVYGLFFNQSVVSGANTERLSGNEAVIGSNEESQSQTSENSSAAKREEEEKNDVFGNDKKEDAPPINETTSPAEKTEDPATAKKDSTAAETTEASNNDEVATASENSEPEKPAAKNVAQYKVRDKAYFHNEPDPKTKRRAFIIHWNDAVLVPQEEKNGFIYVVFVNHLGQTSKGWLSKDELIKVK